MRSTGKHGRLYRIIEARFDGILAFYRRTLDVALRFRFITLMTFLATVALTGCCIVTIPKGFFPTQDIGLIIGTSEGAQDASFDQMVRLADAAERPHHERPGGGVVRLAGRRRHGRASRAMTAASISTSSRGTSGPTTG